MKFKLKKFNQRGDTIVEVLIVLTILSMAFAISASTANRSLVKSRNSEEHSQALGSLSTQVELVKAARNKQVTLPTTVPFCMTSATTYNTSFVGGYTVPDSAKADDFSKYPAACNQRGYYYVVVQYNPSTEDFDFTVRWDGAGKMGRQQEQINYRNYKLTPGVTTIPVGGSAPQLTVYAKVIPPVAVTNGFDTPSCSSAAVWTKDGINVTINQVNGGAPNQSVLTIGSVALFTNVVEGGVYKANVTAPAGFGVCNPNPSGSELVPAGSSAQIDMKIYPICYLGALTHDSLGFYADPISPQSRDSLGVYADAPYNHYGSAYDHYSAPYWHHDGADGRHAEWNSTTGTYSTQPATFNVVEGGVTVQYRRNGSLYSASGPLYERWVWRGDFQGNWADLLGYYSDPAYEHFTGYYTHYTAPYTHYGPWYQPHLCPT